jgi:hypothetical protein
MLPNTAISSPFAKNKTMEDIKDKTQKEKLIEYLFDLFPEYSSQGEWAGEILALLIAVDSISVNDLIREGFEKSNYEWHKCPKCDTSGLSRHDKHCRGCGIKIVK